MVTSARFTRQMMQMETIYSEKSAGGFDMYSFSIVIWIIFIGTNAALASAFQIP